MNDLLSDENVIDYDAKTNKSRARDVIRGPVW